MHHEAAWLRLGFGDRYSWTFRSTLGHTDLDSRSQGCEKTETSAPVISQINHLGIWSLCFAVSGDQDHDLDDLVLDLAAASEKIGIQNDPAVAPVLVVGGGEEEGRQILTVGKAGW